MSINITDSISSSRAIGEVTQFKEMTQVACYPRDDHVVPHHQDVPALSREITDIFLSQNGSNTLEISLIRGLARRLTDQTGGKTRQNLNMLTMLIDLIKGKYVPDVVVPEGW